MMEVRWEFWLKRIAGMVVGLCALFSMVGLMVGEEGTLSSSNPSDGYSKARGGLGSGSRANINMAQRSSLKIFPGAKQAFTTVATTDKVGYGRYGNGEVCVTYSDDCVVQTVVAAKGYDVVSYRAEPDASGVTTPVMGLDSITATYLDYTFYFSSAENKAKFEENPEYYAPRWGGFCSLGIAWEQDTWSVLGLGPPSDPLSWRIMSDGYLHFFKDYRAQLQVYNDYGEDETLQAGGNFWTKFGGDYFNTACFCEEGGATCTCLHT